MNRINWRIAVKNVLPWIKEEMERNGHTTDLIPRGQDKCNRKSIVVTMSVLMEKMGVSAEDKINMKIMSFKGSFQKNIVGKGYSATLYGKLVDGNSAIVITEDPVDIGSVLRPGYEYTVKFDEGYRKLYNRRMKEQDDIRKMRYGPRRKTLSDYKEKLSEILPSIKSGIDKSENGLFIVKIKDLTDSMGYGFDIYGGAAIYNNIKIIMEDYNIVVGMKGYENGDWTQELMTFRDKDEFDRYIWEKEGFENREEYEECLKEDRKCMKIRKIASECKSKDPESVFNNKELIKELFTECPIEDE